MPRADGFLDPLRRAPGGNWQLRNRRTGLLLATRILPALDSTTRRTGLLGRASLGEGEAMIIAPTNAVHTFGMQFAIDVAFVRRDGTVVKARAAVKPWRMTGALRAHCVVELAAGVLERCETVRGDVLEIVS